MRPGTAPLGVLVMAYGTPRSLDELEAYYTHIRRGRPPTAEQLAELRARYAAIGGRSPLLEITRAQVEAIRGALNSGGTREIPVALGCKHSEPFIEDGVAELVERRVREIVAVVLAPHYSHLSVGEYFERVIAAAQSHGPHAPRVTDVPDWHLAPPYLQLLSERVREAIAELPDGVRAEAHVLFTAHSLPARILSDHDPYPDQLRETAEAIAGRAGLRHWSVAWQSAGRTPEPWIGPDVLDAIEALASAGAPAVVVCPAGFVSDHLEVLYDLDIEARARAQALGIAFARTRSPNDSPALADAIAEAVRASTPTLVGAP